MSFLYPMEHPVSKEQSQPFSVHSGCTGFTLGSQDRGVHIVMNKSKPRPCVGPKANASW